MCSAITFYRAASTELHSLELESHTFVLLSAWLTSLFVWMTDMVNQPVTPTRARHIRCKFSRRWLVTPLLLLQGFSVWVCAAVCARLVCPPVFVHTEHVGRVEWWAEHDDFGLSRFIKQLVSSSAALTRWKHVAPRVHQCIAQYAPPTHPPCPVCPAVGCSSANFTKSFKKETEKSSRCVIPVPVQMTIVSHKKKSAEWAESDFGGAAWSLSWALSDTERSGWGRGFERQKRTAAERWAETSNAQLCPHALHTQWKHDII